MNLEEKLMKANGQYGNINTELREARRKIRDYENRFEEQNNVSMMQNMCEEQQKQLLQTESLLEQRKEEIDHHRDRFNQVNFARLFGDSTSSLSFFSGSTEPTTPPSAISSSSSSSSSESPS